MTTLDRIKKATLIANRLMKQNQDMAERDEDFEVKKVKTLTNEEWSAQFKDLLQLVEYLDHAKYELNNLY